ncbi:DUF3352 domain-containing protein [Myxacorys almedinensis]|uniref:DUF3352 domain-containing protein n=1 Tax=Myxacorys almedinensis A TaxID=2690445 RepID=A0A8J7YWD0_9CYAN|nr:DUF3352 domain-containing protein [Myxacorys almedinensis]NDJ15824.1 DUF3352 domain-containing protein [Myxacorys almedinensis A]
MNANLKKSPRNPQLLLTAGAATLLVGGGAIAYWFFSRQGQLSVMPVGANVIPQDALMVLSVTTESNQWRQMREFGTQRSQAAFEQTLTQWRDRLLTSRGLDYGRDVQPWIGKEVTVAFLPPQAGIDNSNPAQPRVTPQPMMMVLPISDPLKAKQTLEQSAVAQGKWAERQYKGVQIRENQGDPAQSMSFAVLDAQEMVLTNHPKAIEKAIDTYKGGAALTGTPGYGDALTQVNAEQPLARFYVNIPAAANTSAANSTRPLPPQSLSQLQQNQGFAGTAILASEGIQFKSISWLKPDSQRRFDTRNNAKIMLNRLPSDTLMMASGGDLKRFWQDYAQGVSANPIRLINPEALKQGIKTTVGLDLEKDFLNWMEGEFTLALVPAQQGAPASLPAGLVFMVKTNDRRSAETTLKRLDETMAAKYTFKVEEAKVAGQSLVNWSLPTANINISRGWLDGDVAFLSLGAPVAQNLLPKPTSALAESEMFRKSTTSDLAQNNGHFFVNVDRLLELKNFPLLQLPIANRSALEAMNAIGVTASVTSDRTARYDVFVMLKKTDN